MKRRLDGDDHSVLSKLFVRGNGILQMTNGKKADKNAIDQAMEKYSFALAAFVAVYERLKPLLGQGAQAASRESITLAKCLLGEQAGCPKSFDTSNSVPALTEKLKNNK